MKSEKLTEGYNGKLYGTPFEPPTKRILIGIPMTGLLRAEWVMARYGQVIPCNWAATDCIRYIDQWSPLNYAVADARNSVAKGLVDHDFEWLLFIDHDTIPPPHMVLTFNQYMLKGDIPIVSGLYFTKSVPSEPLIYRGRGTSFYQDWRMGDKVWVDGIPMGATLIHGSIIKALWNESEEYECKGEVLRRVFVTPQMTSFDPASGNWLNVRGTEDLEFCRRVREDKIFEKAGWAEYQEKEFPFLIDTSIFCRHIDWEGRQFPMCGEEVNFFNCHICEAPAVRGFNYLYWCAEHEPERFKVKQEA